MDEKRNPSSSWRNDEKIVEMVGEIKELLLVLVQHIAGLHGDKADTTTTPLDNVSKKLSNEQGNGVKVDKSTTHTPVDNVVSNRSNSPFINSDGGLTTFSQKSCTKRKLDLDGEENENIDVTWDIKSFNARDVRFNKPQFPPGLETLKDVKEDSKMVEKNSMSPHPIEKTPKVNSTSKTKSNCMSNSVEEDVSKKSKEKRTSRRAKLQDRKLDENEKTPSSKPSSKPKTNKKSKSISNVEQEGTRGSKFLAEIDEMLCDSVKTQKKSKRQVSEAKCTREPVVKTQLGNGLPDPIFKNFLSQISPCDKEICLYIASNKDNQCDRLYSPTNTLHIMDIGESWCVFPDRCLTDHFINVSLYDFHLNLMESGCSTKMVLPTTFQGLVFKSDQRSPYMDFECIQLWCARITSSFFPNDLKKVEEVYMPVLDQEWSHWFLLVLRVLEKKVFIVDSLGVTEGRRKLSMAMMRFAGNELTRNRLGFMFKNYPDFIYVEVEVPHQPNSHDCGMYVLKYIECGDVDGMQKIKYSTDEMRVERLKHLGRIVSSKHNNEFRERFKDDAE